MPYPIENHVKVEQEEGCAIWIIAIVLIWIALMLRGYIKQQAQPIPQQPVIEQQQETVDGQPPA